MPFIAKSRITLERIDITRIKDPRSELLSSDMVCPVCDHPMMIKAGAVKRHHFAHMPGREDCPYAVYSAGETQEHRDAKELIRDHTSEWFDEYLDAPGELEVYIPGMTNAKWRIADVLFTFPGGWQVAHEAQLAAISVEDLTARTEDYNSQGIDVFWWFGRDALKQKANLDWSMRRYGFILEIEIGDAGSPLKTVVLHSTGDATPVGG